MGKPKFPAGFRMIKDDQQPGRFKVADVCVQGIEEFERWLWEVKVRRGIAIIDSWVE